MYRKGFTLVEILIVVIILGILAAIVIPQFTEASQDARASALKSDLQTLRSQLELYKVQHLDHYPDEYYDSSSGSWTADTDNFVSRLTSTTDLYGDTSGSDYGPYLQQFPTNPFASANADDVEFGTGAPNGDGDTGWYFNTDTGQIFANTTDHTSW
ncbi:MAG: type II secretion system protein [Phycisphaerae bacterium]